MTGSSSTPLPLSCLIDTYGYTAGLKGGAPSHLLSFSFDEVRPIYDGFARTVRNLEFDVSELSAVTLLQAHIAGKPLILLPVGLLSRFHHGSTIYRIASGIRSPGDLAGRRIGVRAYTQTTVAWTRGILESDYGFAPDAVTWVTLEEPHIVEYHEPPNVERAENGATLGSILLSGDVDAAIVGRGGPRDATIDTLIPDHRTAELGWWERTGVLPINHTLVVKRDLADRNPWVLDELHRLLAECRADFVARLSASPDPSADDRSRQDLLSSGIDPVPFGVEAVRPAFELLADYCLQQGLIPRPIPFEELVDERVAHW